MKIVQIGEVHVNNGIYSWTFPTIINHDPTQIVIFILISTTPKKMCGKLLLFLHISQGTI